MPTRRKPAGRRALVLIGAYKVAEGVLLVVAGFGLLRLLHRDLEETLTHWVHVIRIDPGNRYVHAALGKAFSITPQRLKELSAGTFIYAALRFLEGFGLMARKRWAEWLTAIVTASFLPLEVWEIFHRLTWIRVGLFFVNVLVLAYLVWVLRAKRPR